MKKYFQISNKDSIFDNTTYSISENGIAIVECSTVLVKKSIISFDLFHKDEIIEINESFIQGSSKCQK